MTSWGAAHVVRARRAGSGHGGAGIITGSGEERTAVGAVASRARFCEVVECGGWRHNGYVVYGVEGCD